MTFAARTSRFDRASENLQGVRDFAEYAGITRIDELLAPGSPLGRAAARGEREPGATLEAHDAAVLRPLWDEVVTLVSGALVFRD